MARAFTVGADFGTNSVRAVVADCADGRVVGTAVAEYASGERGVLLDPREPHLARQNPADWLEGVRTAVRGALAAAEGQSGFARERVIGIGTDTTGSTPLPVDGAARPLALDPKWRGNLAAQAWLWKDHTGAAEAGDITDIASRHAPELLAPIGGRYSSEWYWSKIWHCLKVAPDVFAAAASWVELADYVPAALAGVARLRRRSAAPCAPRGTRRSTRPRGAACRGRTSWRGSTRDWPSCAAGCSTPRIPPTARPGPLSAAWADALGLPPGIPVAMGAFDAHYGAVGAGITAGTLVKIIGTSTCDIAIASAREAVPDIPGICGIVNGSVMPGYYGIEAGQSAVGDLLAWWVERVGGGGDADHARLSVEAARLGAGRVGPPRPGLEQRQPHHPGGSAAHGPAAGPDPGHDARGGLSCADRGHRVRGAGHRRAADRVSRAGGPRGVLRRHRGEERPVHADLRRRARPTDADRRLAADAGPRRGDRGGRGGRRRGRRI